MARKHVEFDEDTVQREMAKALDVDLDDLDVSDSSLSSFGEPALSVSTGRKEWTVVPDEDTAEKLALAVVTQDLEQEPEIFSPSFIESHIDMKALERWVYEAQMEDEYAWEIAQDDPERFWQEASHWGIDVPEPDEDGNMPDEIADEYIEALREEIARDRSKDPMAFFEDIYGRDEATKYAIEAVGIDVSDAAQEAVRIDGWQHFLCRYDGNSYDTENGFVYWREN